MVPGSFEYLRIVLVGNDFKGKRIASIIEYTFVDSDVRPSGK